MKRAPQTLLLAVYSDAASAQDAFSALRSSRYRKCALISGGADTVTVESNALKWPARAALCVAAFAVFLAVALYLGLAASTGIVFASVPAILLWIAIAVLQGGSWTKVLERISAWALPGESLILVDVAPSQARDAQALLRRSASPPIYVVETGGEPLQESQRLEETDICLSEDDFPASVTAWAREEGPLGFASRRETLLKYLSRSEAEFEASLHDLNEAAQLGHTVTAVAEEVMDNAYLVRAHIADIRRNLPKRYAKVLPTLSAHGNELRVYRLACLLANHAESRLNRRKIVDFLDAYQQVSPLRIAELWVFPLMLRLVLIQRLDLLARRVRHLQHLREAAYLWANRLINAVRRGSEYELRMTSELANEWYALDRHFITSLSEQLRDDPNTLAMVQRWAEGSLGLSMSEMVRAQQSEEAGDRVSASNVLGSLRQLSQTDFTEVFETVSRIDEVLRRDPAGVYSSTDFITRDLCRRSVEQTARHSKTSEMDVARLAVEAAAQDPSDSRRGHIGFHLIGDGLPAFQKSVQCRLPLRTRSQRFIRRHASAVYFGSVFAITASLAAAAVAIAYQAIPGNYLLLLVLGLASLFPLSDLAIQIVNALMTSLLPPTTLPKLDFEKGIPEECTTLVVVPMMLSSPATVRSEIEKLEVRFFSNRNRGLYFALLSDFNDAPEQHMREDDALQQLAIDETGELNARHAGQPFLLFHRNRIWSETEQLWIGRERKRGKIEELNRYLCGEKVPGGITLRAGNLPASIQYVITLDSDTQLPAGTARRMIETIAHPLNRAEIGIDESGQPIRKRGYSIIQPRISIALPSATATRFTRLFNDTTGTDPYCQAVSDVYQDLFGEGIYHGKAIYDLHAFHQVLDNRFPPETLLSHDLIEGVYAGVALASDIELLENFPLNYPAYSQRLHRWIRGDWQIAPWIRSQVPDGTRKWVRNTLSLVSRWKIFDNLRRSLVPVGSLTLLLTGWLSGTIPVLWSLIVGAALLVPVLVVPMRRLTDRLRGRVYSWTGAADELKRAVVMAALLPHQAWLAVDAVARVWYRRLVTRRHLLEWQTAEVSNLVADRHLSRIVVQMFAICGSVALLTSGLFWAGIVWPTLPYLALWLISPELLAFIGAQSQAKATPLREKDKVFLRLVARRTWRFFDELVNEENHWLPPDNYQMALRREVAQRTSPTNIGLWLTSALAGCDFGYLTTDEFLARVSETLRSMQGLERYEGHLLNWYDTRTLEPLAPKYVSTVDSGNLLASLWVLEQGCESLATAPIIGTPCLRGLMDTLAAAAKVCGNDAAAAVPLRNLRGLFDGEGVGLEVLGKVRLSRLPVEQLLETLRWSADPGDERHYWITRLYLHTTAWTAAADRYLRWLELLAGPPDEFVRALGKQEAVARAELLKDIPSLRSLAGEERAELRLLLDVRLRPDGVPGKVRNWLDAVETEYQRSKDAAADALAKLNVLQEAAHTFADAIDMRLLYDESRHLFAIGYRVGAPPEFNSHYDLLASECRLASLVAIAKGDVPVEHWLALGRPYRTLPSGQVLLSWGGTMFEYLMPLVYTHTHENSLLDNATRQAVERQIEYCSSLRVPWGISESAYSAVDRNQIYQYRAFGVPGLGLKPGLEDDLVVSPYSTALALQVDPHEAVKNLQELTRIGLSGPMGFIEAIDFTRENQRGDRGVPIETYMAHHQAMALLAIDNTLNANVMQTRFHRDLRVKAVEPLLFERIPATVSLLTDSEPEQIRPHMALDIGEPADRVLREDTPIPRAHLLGNGQYSVMLTNAGGGYSRWRDFDITRWRSDTTLDHWGSFCYLKDQRSGLTWSTGYHPVAAEDKSYFARFAADKVEFVRRETGLETLMEITISPEDDAEIRRLSLTNRASRARELEVTSYLELVLAPHAADRAHPAFNKMFVETEVLPDRKALIARRRLRAPEDPEIWVGHLVVCSACKDTLQFETDRATFIGRGGSLQRPAALRRDLTDTAGAVLDPIFSLRQQLVVGPREKAYMTFVTVAGESRDAVLRLIDKYHRLDNIRRSFEMAWTHAQLEFRYLGIEADSSHWFQELASHLLFPNLRMRAPAQRLAHNRLGQSRLWAHGISGDLPILLVTAADRASLDLVREALHAHTYWRLRGFKADLVILNQESPGYDQPLHFELQKLVEAHSVYAGMDRPGGVFLRKWHLIPEEELTQIYAVARATLSGNRGTLAKQVSRAGAAPRQLPAPFVPRGRVEEQPSPPLPFLELPYFNGLGGFTPDGREYAIYFEPDAQTPTPWVNVMANPSFGAVVSESGPVFCWSGNSQQNRLTPWENDPVLNPPNSIFYIRDEDSGVFWTPTRQPIRERDAYRARHGQGYTVFEHNSHAIEQILTIFVPVNEAGGDPIQVQRLSLRNHSSRKRRFAISFYAEWTLGTNREETAPHIVTTWDEPSGSLMATNYYQRDSASPVAFAALLPRATSYTGDRTHFLGRNRSLASPAAMRRVHLGGHTGAGLDPCAALQTMVEIDPGQRIEVLALLGEARDEGHARELLQRYGDLGRVEAEFSETCQFWDTMLGAVQVRTPVLSIDLLMNRWLLYQTLSCRVWARSAFYQSGGAFGFRDQLQDVLGLLYSAPHLARAHIIEAAAHQFVEGDVQHWWHPGSGLGIRGMCSDDLVWLPFAVTQYVAVTGDESVLDEVVPFLEGPHLAEGEHEKLFVAAVSSESASVFEHCKRTLTRASALGPHGLPLIGNGDWNDGMNRIGLGGKGESVWLGWFLIDVLTRFAGLCDQRDPASAQQYRQFSGALARAIEAEAWDGEWYRRAYFDDGTPVGSRENSEARIDSLPQSWAAISGAGDPQRTTQALQSVDRHLVRADLQTILLFTPPFDQAQPHPGYIMGYPPGIRENGGQYTHGALWLAMAHARLRNGARAVELLQYLNPIEHSRKPEDVLRYQSEPYAVAADVYNAPGREGKGGWTWYTGSAAWMYRVWLEEVLGLRVRGNQLTLEPAIPKDWPGFEITYRYRTSTYHITFDNKSPVTDPSINGEPAQSLTVEMVDDGNVHDIVLHLPPVGELTPDKALSL